MEAANAPKLALVTTLQGLLFGTLAILVKLHITARLAEGSDEPNSGEFRNREEFWPPPVSPP